MNCFLNEQDPREQAAINELTKKTPQRHATTTTSVATGFDNCVETKLRLDIILYIRPWRPGWSFLRRIYIYIYTGRGSERVKERLLKLIAVMPIYNEQNGAWFRHKVQ